MFKCRDEIDCLPPYELGKAFTEEMQKAGVKRVVKLNSNEGPYPPFSEAIAAINEAAVSLNRYPDPVYAQLRCALSARYQVPMERIIVGPGSSNLIRSLCLVAIDPGDEVVIGWPTFPPYVLSAQIMSGVVRKVPLVNHTHDLPAMLDAINDRTKIVIICNPNNPTGTIISKSDLDDYFEQVPAHVLTLLDEAYIEYVVPKAKGNDDIDCPNGVDYLNIGKPAIVLRTFSKVYGLAGLRVGYGFTDQDLAETIIRSQEGFVVSHLAQIAALASLERDDLVRERVEENAAGLAYFTREFERMGLDFARSHANFAWVDVRRDSREMFRKLMLKGVLVRPGYTYDSPTHIRITVGSREENEIFVDALRETIDS